LERKKEFQESDEIMSQSARYPISKVATCLIHPTIEHPSTRMPKVKTNLKEHPLFSR